MRCFFKLSFFYVLILVMLSACAPKPVFTATSTVVLKDTPIPTSTIVSSNMPEIVLAKTPVLPTFILTPTQTLTLTAKSPAISTTTAHPTESSEFSVGGIVELTSIHMVSETDGWGLNKSTVLITRDGGQTWHAVTPPEHLSGEARIEAYGGFVDANHAWVLYATLIRPPVSSCIASDSSVWYTTDGGQTWKVSQPLMHDLSDMSCRASFSMIDTQTGWLSINGWYTGAGPHTSTQFFHTTDGGVTWNALVASWCDSTGSCSFHTPGWLSDKVFYNRTGWQLINMSECWPCYGSTPAPAYYITTDGGVSWRFRYLPAPLNVPDLFDQYWVCEPYQLNLLTEKIARLKIACSDNREGPGEIDYLYATEDGGITWNTYELPMSSAAMSDYYTRMIFFNADHGLLLGRKMWRTADGGKTWQHINTVTWDGQFSFVDSSRGWAIAKREEATALVFTINGGVDWQMLNPVGVP